MTTSPKSAGIFHQWLRIFLVSIGLVSLSMNGGQYLGGTPLLIPSPQAPSPQQSLTAQGKVYYVASSTGRDSNPGTETLPWQTIQKAANTMVAGDMVYIRQGTYGERVIPKNSGGPSQYIVYAAYPGETATIDGSNVSLPANSSGLLQVSAKSYIWISGLHVINAGPNMGNAGILVTDSSHIIIEKNHTYNTVSSGIGVWRGNDITIDGNEVELACNDGAQEAITVADTDTFEVKNNIVHNGGPGTHGGEGIDPKGSSNGKIYRNHVYDLSRIGILAGAWDERTYNIQVFQNLVHDNRDNGIVISSEAGGLADNIKVYNNVVYHNKYVGILLSNAGPSSTHPLKNIQIINNTVYSNGWTWGGGIRIQSLETEGTVIRNNIVSQNKAFQIDVNTSIPANRVTVDHNLIDGFVGWYEGETRGTDYVEGNPRFVNAASADLHLQANSPAIDAGTANGAPSDDFDGYPRDQKPDIGAFELSMLIVVPSSRAIDPGDVTTYVIEVRSADPFSIMSLTAASPSPSLTLHLSPTQVISLGQATLTVTDSHPGPTLLPGLWFSIPITVTDGVTQTVTAHLLVGGARVGLPLILRGR